MEEQFWHKSYASGVPAHLDFERVTIPQALTRSAGGHGDEVIAYAKEKTAARKMPGSVEFVESLSKPAVGKTLGRKLRVQEIAKT